MDALVVYYSRTGHTRRLAKCIAEVADADLEEITEAGDHEGPWGWFKCVLEAAGGLMPRLLDPIEPPAGRDIVFLGGPLWMGRCAPAVRAYARERLHGADRVAFFATQGAGSPQRAWSDLEALARMPPAARLAIRHRDLGDPALREQVQRFVRTAGRRPRLSRGRA
ncbi:MAG: flavodoxin family protein [Pseudomonadota bacterium]